jgi:autotransporter-associated beta strand protein
VFVRDGGTLTITNGSFAGSNGVTGGTGSPGTLALGGAAAGSSLFLMTGATTTFNATTSMTIAGTIADDSANSLPGGTYTAGSAAGAAILKTGAGTLTLSGANTYSGGTTVADGTIALSHVDGSKNVDAVGSGTITLAGGGILATINNSATINNYAVNSGTTGTISAAAGVTFFINGALGQTFVNDGSLVRFGDQYRHRRIRADRGVGHRQYRGRRRDAARRQWRIEHIDDPERGNTGRRWGDARHVDVRHARWERKSRRHCQPAERQRSRKSRRHGALEHQRAGGAVR